MTEISDQFMSDQGGEAARLHNSKDSADENINLIELDSVYKKLWQLRTVMRNLAPLQN